MPYYSIGEKVYSDQELLKAAEKQGYNYNEYVNILKKEKGLQEVDPGGGKIVKEAAKNTINAIRNIPKKIGITFDAMQATTAAAIKESGPGFLVDAIEDNYKDLDQIMVEQQQQMQEKSKTLLPTQDVLATVREFKKTPELADIPFLLSGILTGISEAAPTVIPSILTSKALQPFVGAKRAAKVGSSLIIPQIVSHSVVDYNVTKAEKIYGKNDPDAFEKLIENNQDEYVTPVATGLVSASFERLGYLGIQNVILGKHINRSITKQILSAGGVEAATEWFQSGIDFANRELAKGKDVKEAGLAGWNAMRSDYGKTAAILGATGGGGIAGFGATANRVLNQDRALLIDNKSRKAMQEYVTELEDLNEKRKNANSQVSKDNYIQQYKETKNQLKNFLDKELSQGNYLNEEETSNMRDVLNQSDLLESQIDEVIDQYNNKEMSIEERNDNMRVFNKRRDNINAQITEIKNVAAKRMIEGDISIIEDAARKEGVGLNVYDDASTFENISIKAANIAGTPFTQEQLEDLPLTDAVTIGGNIYINKEVAIKQGRINVVQHELLHVVLDRHFSDKIEDLPENLNIYKGFMRNFSGQDQDFINSAIKNEYGYDDVTTVSAKEYVTVVSDLVRTGRLKFNEPTYVKVGKYISEIISKIIGKPVSFSNGTQVYEFLKEFQNSIQEGEINKTAFGLIRDGKIPIKTAQPKTTKTSKAAVRTFKKKFNELAEKYTLKEWQEGGSDVVIGDIYEDLIKLVRSKIPINKPPGFSAEDFISGAVADLIPHIRNFNINKQKNIPLEKRGLYGWISSQLNNKVAGIFKKGEAATREAFTERVEEAAGVAEEQQFEDEFDEISMQEPKDRISKIRQIIGLATKQMNLVRRTVVRALITSPKVNKSVKNNPRAFQKYLREFYQLQLFKLLKNHLGIRKEYKSFIENKAFDLVYYYTPLSSIVASKMDFLYEAVIDPNTGKQAFMTVEEANKAGIPLDKAGSGPPKWKLKKVTPELRKDFVDWSFMRGDKPGIGINPDTNKPYTRNTLGNRKDIIATFLAEEVGFDATMEVAQNPEQNQYDKEGNEILDKDGKPVTINILERLGMNNQEIALEKITAIVSDKIQRDPTIKFSKTLAQSSQKKRDAFDAKSGEFMRLVTENPNAIDEIFEELYGKVFTARQVSKIKNELKDLIQPFLAKQAEIENDYTGGEFIINIIQEYQLRQGLKHIIGLPTRDKKGNKIGDFTNLFQLGQARKASNIIFKELIKKLGISNAIELLYGTVKGSWRLGRGGIEAVGVEKFEENKYITKGNFKNFLWRGKEDFVKYSLSTVEKGIEYVKGRQGFFQDGNKILFDEKTNPYYAKPTPEGFLSGTFLQQLPERIAFAKKQREGLREISKILQKQYGEKINKTDLLMILMNMNSNIYGLVRSAAIPGLIQKNLAKLVNSDKQIRYEHTQPAKEIILKLADHIVNNKDDANFDSIFENYRIALVTKSFDTKVTKAGFKEKTPIIPYYKHKYPSRYAQVKGAPVLLDYETNKQGDTLNPPNIKFSKTSAVEKAAIRDNAIRFSRRYNNETKGISVFDFDDTIAKTKSKVIYTLPSGKKGKLTGAQFAAKGEILAEKGAKFDFSEFSKIIEGKKGPLFELAQRRKAKFGNKNIFILTARPKNAALPIFEFLNEIGLSLPLENVIALENSTAKAKADWVISKVSEGYNDFYFADDAYSNVKAVQEVLNEVDVKRNVQQVKMSRSKNLSKEFNDIIEAKTGISFTDVISAVQAKTIGANKGKFNFFIPYSAEDFTGLLYTLLYKGKIGDNQMAWFKKHLLDPFGRAMNDLASERIIKIQEYEAVKEQLKPYIPGGLQVEAINNYTLDQAIRVYIWTRQGTNIPEMSEQDQQMLYDFVDQYGNLVEFAEQLMRIHRSEKYTEPDNNWMTGTITTDILNGINTVSRAKYLEEWQQNVDIIFSEQNLNKLEASFGSDYVAALRNSLERMKTGRNRKIGMNKFENRITEWINNSVGAIMFINMRSALLQAISLVNFINWKDNNIYAAGKAFANQPQYWEDFNFLINSDFLVDRRQGLKININEADIAEAAQRDPYSFRGALNYLLKKGFMPTQIMDSFAIASGGATFYRNRVNTYINKGYTQEQAERQAYDDWTEIASENQQSSRPDKISQQQASGIGRLILAFANTPSQYARIIKKASLDLMNGRGDARTNISKIVYYTALQNFIFNALQQALFALVLSEDEDDEKNRKKYISIGNGMLDSLLRGTGYAGAAVSAIKNFSMEMHRRSKWKRPNYKDSVWKLFDVSPPIDSKVSKLRSALWLLENKQSEIKEKGFSLYNPAVEVVTKTIEAAINLPLDRIRQKVQNIDGALDQENDLWKRICMALGWPEWQLGEEKDK